MNIGSKAVALTVGIASLAIATAASGNDSTAELAAGGLVMTKSPAIEMRAEDLYISTKQVRVRYRFANTSDKDVTVTVAFPMPDITTHGFDDTISIPTQDPVNIMGFSTTVDGQPVKAEVERKAIANGVDQTAYLTSLGVPLAPHLQATNDFIQALPRATRDALVKRGLAVIDQYGDATTMTDHWEATWTLKTTYYWRQTFPAGKELAVEHQYTPSVGGTVGTAIGTPGYGKEPEFAARRKHYCIDDGFMAAVEKTKKPGNDYPPLYEERVEYILSTGANWKAPIGDFRMVVDKGDAANIISFCADGVTKISPTQFEVRHTNFTPTGDVSILILEPAPVQ